MALTPISTMVVMTMEKTYYEQLKEKSVEEVADVILQTSMPCDHCAYTTMRCIGKDSSYCKKGIIKHLKSKI